MGKENRADSLYIPKIKILQKTNKMIGNPKPYWYRMPEYSVERKHDILRFLYRPDVMVETIKKFDFCQSPNCRHRDTFDTSGCDVVSLAMNSLRPRLSSNGDNRLFIAAIGGTPCMWSKRDTVDFIMIKRHRARLIETIHNFTENHQWSRQNENLNGLLSNHSLLGIYGGTINICCWTILCRI